LDLFSAQFGISNLLDNHLSLLLLPLDIKESSLDLPPVLLLAFNPLLHVEFPIFSEPLPAFINLLLEGQLPLLLDFSLPHGLLPETFHLFDFLQLHFVALLYFGFLLLQQSDAVLHLLQLFFCFLTDLVLSEHLQTVLVQELLVVDRSSFLVGNLRSVA
jgi:hypothetical protein